MGTNARTILCSLILGLATRPCAAADPAVGRPNVVIILSDDQGYADVGCQGCKDVPTPHIDSIAKNGTRCTNGYVSHPFCSPTRAGLMTGRYQQRFGHENNPKYDPHDESLGLPLTPTTVADVLKSTGYATGAVGKWHLGAAPHFHPTRRGFAEYFGFLGGGHQYLPVPARAAEYAIPLQRNRDNVTETEYLTDAFSREAAAFIDRHQKEPFFLYLAYNAVHTPMQAPPKYLERVAGIADPKRRTYAAMLSALDDGVGRVLAKLRERGLEEKTLVVFLSDNGGPPAANGSRNDPLRGAKGDVFEGGIRVPFLVQWKGHLPTGVTFDDPVISLDLFPTVLSAAGTTPPAGVKLDGVNVLPYLLKERPGAPHERLFWRTDGGTRWAVRQGRHKLLNAGDGKPQLYDLAADISETHDLAAANPQLVSQLQAAYTAWNAELVKPLWPNPRAAARPTP
jgi:arylsulfatase A-like enzyme